jgi:hypothetical protein
MHFTTRPSGVRTYDVTPQAGGALLIKDLESEALPLVGGDELSIETLSDHA